jgi:hypothetical protein
MIEMRRRSLTFVLPVILINATCFAGQREELISETVQDHFRPVTGWHMVERVSAVEGEPRLASTKGKSGSILVNSDTKAKIPYLFTTDEYGDVALSMEFMIPKGSNAGIYFMGRYEIQILDSYGKSEVTYGDLGGIYQRWRQEADGKARGYEGVAPSVNAAKAPGEWQKIDAVFRAPRFDVAGNKVENAHFESVYVNGKLVQEDVSVTGPTRAAPLRGEAATGPISIQGDHGPIAIRSFVVTPQTRPID